MVREEKNVRNAILFAMLLSGLITLIIFVITLVAESYFDDLSFYTTEPSFQLHEATVKMGCYISFIFLLFVYAPCRLGTLEKIISKKNGIILVIILTYLLSSVFLAVFLSLSTEMVDYNQYARENTYTKQLLDELNRREENKEPCTFHLTFNFKESFFDAVSAFTTTGLTAFEETGMEISKIDAQPPLIHIIRATYLWIGGLGIMFFYLYFTPVPSLMMSMGYEIAAERSPSRFIRLEGFSFSMVYVIVTILGIVLLFLSISNAASVSSSPEKVDNEIRWTYSIVLSFSSISTGGFSPGSGPVNELKVSYVEVETSTLREYPIINNWGLFVIMVLMLAGAMPIFSLHRPLKFFRRWKLFLIFFLPIIGYIVFSYSQGPQVSLYRSFDAISAFTTTGLYTSQFEEDLRMPPDSTYMVRYDKKRIMDIYGYRFRSICLIVLMFIGGAAYSTAGGWGFFNFYFVLNIIYLIVTGKLERSLSRYILKLIMSFLLFIVIFAAGTLFCYYSELFGTLSGPEPAATADYVINSAFYEISALSTVGLMPEIIQDEGIYYNFIAYATLAFSMLIGRLYYIIFPFLVSPGTEEGTCNG